MKKLFILFFIFLITVQYSFSQSTKGYRNELSTSRGLSLPVGDFGSTSTSNRESGYAKLGEMVNLSFTHKIHKELGITAMLYGQANDLNTKTVSKQYAQAGFFPDASGHVNHYPNWSFDKKTWYLGSLLIGVSDEFFPTKNDKFSFTAKALLGVAYAELPKLNGASKSDTSYATVTQSTTSALGFSYLVGVGAKYRFGNRFYILGDIDYFGNSISFKNVKNTVFATNGLLIPGYYTLINSVGPIRGSTNTSTVKQSIGSVNINIGVGFTL